MDFPLISFGQISVLLITKISQLNKIKNILSFYLLHVSLDVSGILFSRNGSITECGLSE